MEVLSCAESLLKLCSKKLNMINKKDINILV